MSFQVKDFLSIVASMVNRIRATTQLITDFLNGEYQQRRLLGSTPAQAFFVRCDLTTMTQVDLDNGRMVCLIGVSLLRPAEFVIFRIGQFTASSTQSS